MADISKTAALIVAKEVSNPFEHADVVTMATHKSLRGPRSGIIVGKADLKEKIDTAVFPMLFGGPHNHKIGAVAAHLKAVNSPAFTEYAQQAKKNAVKFAEEITKRGYEVQTGGTDTAEVLVRSIVKHRGVDGNTAERALAAMNVSVTKQALVGDACPEMASGIRVGTFAVTARGYKEEDMEMVADWIDQGLNSANTYLRDDPDNPVTDHDEIGEWLKKSAGIRHLANETRAFSSKFPVPGFDAAKIDC